MAKARSVPLDPTEPYREAAARVVRVRAEELFEHAEGVLDTADIERVHDMRVATRRLRAVLEIFAPCFPKKRHRAVLRDVKALADALGERRDPDVHIAALERFAAAVPEADRPGVAELVGARCARPGGRQHGARRRARALREPASTCAAALRALATRPPSAACMKARARSRASTPPARWPTTPSASCACGSTSCARSCPRALDPAEVAALHDMRIAAKRLRYILELTAPCFGALRARPRRSTAQGACRTCSARSTTAT